MVVEWCRDGMEAGEALEVVDGCGRKWVNGYGGKQVMDMAKSGQTIREDDRGLGEIVLVYTQAISQGFGGFDRDLETLKEILSKAEKAWEKLTLPKELTFGNLPKGSRGMDFIGRYIKYLMLKGHFAMQGVVASTSL